MTAAVPHSPSPFAACGGSSPSRRETEKMRRAGGRRVALLGLALLALTLPAQSQTLTDQRQRLAAAKRDAVVATRRAEALTRAASGERDAAERARTQEAALAARMS